MVETTGMLQEENMEASLSALKEFSAFVSQYGAVRVKAVATSALREASNASDFVGRVLNETGLQIEVITGEREAELTLRGILAAFRDTPLMSTDTALILDIGGGSTEWILRRDGLPPDMGSIPTGVIKLAQGLLKTDPVTEDDLNRLDNAILAAIEELKPIVSTSLTEGSRLIGTGGTFTTIASMDLGLNSYSREKVHLHKVSLTRLRAIGKKLTGHRLEERRRIKGLEPARADLIIPGVHFTINVMESFSFSELTISDYGLIEGALLEIERDIS